MKEVDGINNSETLVEVADKAEDFWRYVLYPITGKTHQLRVHMTALGASIRHDPFYPEINGDPDDHERPLQLLAQAVRFDDPLTGAVREFETQLKLQWL